MQRFTRSRLPSTPWKNGGGSTSEVMVWPVGAGIDDFDWRVSIATIAKSGPFSIFPGVDRRIMLLEGDDVQLSSVDGANAHPVLTPLQPFAFDGDTPLGCTLLGGASTDLNVMTRRSRYRSELEVLRTSGVLAAAPHGLLLTLGGRWRVKERAGGSGAPMTLTVGEGLYWTDTVCAWEFDADDEDACLATVRILSV